MSPDRQSFGGKKKRDIFKQWHFFRSTNEVIHCLENNYVCRHGDVELPCVHVWQAELSNLDGNGWDSVGEGPKSTRQRLKTSD